MNRRAPLAAAAALLIGTAASAQETFKVAYIDPLSGPMANIGTNILHTFQYLAERESGKANPAGVKFEVVPFDNKGSAQESLSVLKAATDQGIRYIVQGNGSAPAMALIDAINKHNERNPGKDINVVYGKVHRIVDGGVEIKGDKGVQTLRADHVITCAGGIGTPQAVPISTWPRSRPLHRSPRRPLPRAAGRPGRRRSSRADGIVAGQHAVRRSDHRSGD